MTHIGRMDSFDESKEDFESYKERLEQWLKSNAVKDELKVCTFLTVVGSEAYKVLKNLMSPDLPATKTFQE